MAKPAADPEVIVPPVIDDSPQALAAPTVEATPAREGETVLLSAEDLAEIKAEALKQFKDGRKKQLRAVAIKSELARLHREAGGDVVDGAMGDLVSFMVDLPENSPSIIFNQRRYDNGRMVTLPRHQAAMFLDIMWRGRVAEHNLSGKTRNEFYRQTQAPIVSKDGMRVSNEQIVVA